MRQIYEGGQISFNQMSKPSISISDDLLPPVKSPLEQVAAGLTNEVRCTSTLRICQQEAIECAKSRVGIGHETNLSLCTGAGKSLIIRSCSQLAGIKRCILVFPSLDLLRQYYNDHKEVYSKRPVFYLATEKTLKKIPRLSSNFMELQNPCWDVFTTYASAPDIFEHLDHTNMPSAVIHDEAHHIVAPIYGAALAKISAEIYTINLSATLPDSKVPHYKYPLLKGIRDHVVRDFNLDLFLCVDHERENASHATALLELIIQKLLTQHKNVKLLIYTREANTSGDGVSSVNTFLAAHKSALQAKGWWIEGIKEDTVDREALLRGFEKNTGPVSILVSCRTLSEGIDLHGANCMLPWDPTNSITDNIQRIGRVLRLYKGQKEQPPSTVLIPVFLPVAEYEACGGDQKAIHNLLEVQIKEGERGNFRPIVNVCTALKSELAEEDSELFNMLLNYPHKPNVTIDRGLVDCVAKACKKSESDVLEAMASALEEKDLEEVAEAVRDGDWSEEDAGNVVSALADSQAITLVVQDGKDTEIFGKGTQVVTVEKHGDNYKSVKSGSKKAAKDLESARKRVAHRMRVTFSDECQILLGLYSIDGADTMGGLVLSRLTTEVQVDENWEIRLQELVEQCKILGRFPFKNFKSSAEKHAQQWLDTQRQAKKKGTLTLTRQEKLTTVLPGWDMGHEEVWDKRLQELIAQYKKLEKLPSQTSKDVEEERTGCWLTEQKIRKRNGVLSSERERKLTLAIPGWDIGHEGVWDVALQKLVKQYNLMGRFPREDSDNLDEKRAAQWLRHQRAENKKGELLPERCEKLTSAIPGWEVGRDEAWDSGLQELITQYMKLGRLPTQGSKDSDEQCAARWLNRQRQANKKGVLTIDHNTKLTAAIPEWIIGRDEKWDEALQELVEQYKILKKCPTSDSCDPDQKKVGGWLSRQRQAKKRGTLTSEREVKLTTAIPEWYQSYDESWDIACQELIDQYKRLGRFPSRTSRNAIEKRSSEWLKHQRQLKKKGDLTPERDAKLTKAIPGWDGHTDPTPTIPTDVMAADTIQYIDPKTPTSIVRKRKAPKPASEKSTEETSTHHIRQRSELEAYHKRFKSMNADTYASTIAENRAEFGAYHDIADAYDARDPPERQPLRKIASLLEPMNRPSYTAIDLGCGRNRLRTLPSVNRMKWSSLDVYAVDDTVIVGDMGALPFEEETYDIAVLSRSLWARNHMDVLREIWRILKVGGRAVICESFRRWLSDEGENELIKCLRECGFEVIKEEGTSDKDLTEDVFQYVVVRK